MKKFLTVLCLCFVSVVAFGEPTYNCKYQDKQKTGFLGLNERSWWGSDYRGYLYCGHVGTDGCKDDAVVEMNNESLLRCINHAWIRISGHKIDACDMESITGFSYFISGNYFIFYKKGDNTEALEQYCAISNYDMKKRCINSGGEWNSTVCTCPVDTTEKDGNESWSPCKCKSDLVLGSDLNGNNPNKCWPRLYLDGKCLQSRDSTVDWHCPKYTGEYGDHAETNPAYNFHSYYDKYCYCDDWANNSRVCINGDHAEYRANCNCPGFSYDEVKTAYNNGEWNSGTDDDGFRCYKPTTPATKYNYKSCSSDSDCTGIDNTVRPYLHSTAWHCAWQSAGVRVCTATACETGWTPKNGYCQKEEPQQTAQAQETPTPGPTTTIGTHNAATAFTKKTCSDVINMDSNCKCTIVPETVEQNGKCVCSDSNKEIKNGKCEYTATYISTLQSGINNTYDSLRATMSGFKVNVWRDEQGNFNTARLASDSIAGVVLGTVGGIVTANVVKKSQVKKGFEDIQCHIGGQSVANFGDEFTVGR